MDIALLARCSVSQLDKIAAHEGWTRGKPARHPQPAKRELSEALAAVQAGLRQPDLARRDFRRLLDRAMALTAAEALAGAAGLEPTAQTLTRLASAAKSMPDDTPPAPAPGRVIDPNEPMPFPDANELIEEIARRFEQDGNDYLDPRILAILAETIP